MKSVEFYCSYHFHDPHKGNKQRRAWPSRMLSIITDENEGTTDGGSSGGSFDTTVTSAAVNSLLTVSTADPDTAQASHDQVSGGHEKVIYLPNIGAVYVDATTEV